jgi:hypothetical protein
MPPPKLLKTRILPVPHSTYVHGTAISVKLAIAIVILIVVVVIFSACLCCICVRRSKTRKMARKLELSKALPPKINRASAKFYGPGIRVEEVEMGSFVGQDKGEVRMPERVWVRWKDALRGRVLEG